MLVILSYSACVPTKRMYIVFGVNNTTTTKR